MSHSHCHIFHPKYTWTVRFQRLTHRIKHGSCGEWPSCSQNLSYLNLLVSCRSSCAFMLKSGRYFRCGSVSSHEYWHHSGGTTVSAVSSEADHLSLFSEERSIEDGEQLLQGSDLQKHPDPVAIGGFGHCRDPAAAVPCQRRRPHKEEVPRQVKSRIVRQPRVLHLSTENMENMANVHVPPNLWWEKTCLILQN